MSKQNFYHVLQILVPLLLFIQSSNSDPDQIHFRGGRCTPFDNFTPNSTYQTNVLSLLSELNLESSNSKFFNLSTGAGSNRVNGLYHCRPDLSLETCNACIIAATQMFFDKCAIKKEAIMWYEECTIRYSNRSIFSVKEIEPSAWASSIFNVSQPDTFLSLLNSTMEGLIAKATLPSNTERFATSKDNFTLFEGLFGLALCTPDITSFECEECLRTALMIFPTCCGDLVQYVTVFLPSCHIRYDTAPFIIETPAPAPSPALHPTSAPFNAPPLSG
ncbi:cysteine-rich repeat secretory protein 9-like [Beta vulgaris subsp. vulgaris]|uniref:cysteine-rich repeat secretory protein 9-like n=1 Tax=Beta vulgaris subsp. vulgaris TaxID=3555 RepID=UPI002036F412|nr:cysteine-rich repeat secretory protein 9-like [Beta vulgaris subsp. vulgaris]